MGCGGCFNLSEIDGEQVAPHLQSCAVRQHGRSTEKICAKCDFDENQSPSLGFFLPTVLSPYLTHLTVSHKADFFTVHSPIVLVSLYQIWRQNVV